MKKFFYILAICVSASAFFTSCTEDEVSPNTELNGGGSLSADKGN